jgi:hypothetical protein
MAKRQMFALRSQSVPPTSIPEVEEMPEPSIDDIIAFLRVEKLKSINTPGTSTQVPEPALKNIVTHWKKAKSLRSITVWDPKKINIFQQQAAGLNAGADFDGTTLVAKPNVWQRAHSTVPVWAEVHVPRVWMDPASHTQPTSTMVNMIPEGWGQVARNQNIRTVSPQKPEILVDEGTQYDPTILQNVTSVFALQTDPSFILAQRKMKEMLEWALTSTVFTDADRIEMIQEICLTDFAYKFLEPKPFPLRQY